jgi:hypothetical protein
VESRINLLATDAAPRYGRGWSSYAWVRVAGPSFNSLVRNQVRVSWQEFSGKWYWLADSNRFTSDVLGHLGIGLTPSQQRLLGPVPGFGFVY